MSGATAWLLRWWKRNPSGEGIWGEKEGLGFGRENELAGL